MPLSKLVELLEICSKCGKKCFVGKPSYMGSAVTFRVVCGLCTQKRQWSNTAKAQSQPLINLLVASGILFSGSLPTKFLRALAMIGVQVMSRQTFHQYQKKYLHGVSHSVHCRIVNFHVEPCHIADEVLLVCWPGFLFLETS